MNMMKKLLSCVLALTMLMTTLPAPSLAVTSEPYPTQRSEAPSAAYDAVQEAIAYNATYGTFVGVQRVWADPSTGVATGANFQYALQYTLEVAPPYADDYGVQTLCYTSYDDITITIVVPESVELTGVESASARGTLTHVEGRTYTYTIPAVAVSDITYHGTLTLNARMTNNGTAISGTAYAPLDVSMTADVTIAESETIATFISPATCPDNRSGVTNTADSAWLVTKKTRSIAPAAEDADVIRVTYDVEVGLNKDGVVTQSDSSYDKPGVLKYTAMSLQDTVPTFTDALGNTVEPTAFSMALLDASGQPIPEKTVTGTAASLTLDMSYFNTLMTTGLGGGGAGADGKPTAIELPAYSHYLVTADYPRASFKQSYEQGDEKFSLLNTVQLTATLADGTVLTPQAEAPAQYADKTYGGWIQVDEYLRLTLGDVAYDAIYAELFQPTPQATIYHASDFDAALGQPVTGAQAVQTLTIGSSSAVSDALCPGEYVVVQTRKPEDAKLVALDQADLVVPDEKNWIAVTVAEQGTASCAFTNEPAASGIVSLRKVREDGRTAFAEVSFTLTPVDATSGLPTYTGKTGVDGTLHLLVKPGVYTLSEEAPTGYMAVADQTITVQSGDTVDLTEPPLVNKRNTATLTLNKYAVFHEGSAASERVPVAEVAADTTAFAFQLAYSTDADFADGDKIVVREELLVLGANDSSLTVTLPQRAEDGKATYYYRLTEVRCGDQFVKNETPLFFDFSASDQVTLSMDNLVLGKVKLGKQAVHLGQQYGTVNAADAGRTFLLYRQGADSAYALADTLVTVDDGDDTSSAVSTALPIRDAEGTKITYYVVEGPHDGYTVTYPAPTTNITVDGQTVAAWPITLSDALMTDLTASTVVNKVNRAQVQIVKRQNVTANNYLSGAAFSVYDETEGTWFAESDATPFVTDDNGCALVSGLALNHTYRITEATAPTGYRLSDPDWQEFTTSTPADTQQLVFHNNKKPILHVEKGVVDPVTGSAAALGSDRVFTFELYRLIDGQMQKVDGVSPLTVNASDDTATTASSASVMLEEQGAYYLRETAITNKSGADCSAEYIDTAKVDPTNANVHDGVYYFGPFTALDNGETTAAAVNRLNSGVITLSKFDKYDMLNGTTTPVAGAKYTIRVSTADTAVQARLASLGFTAGEPYTLAVDTGAEVSVTIGKLPIYNADGSALTYTVAETEAPEGYLLPDDKDNSRDVTLATLSAAKFTAVETFCDAPITTLTALKMYYEQWAQDTGHQVNMPLSGATLAIYRVQEDGTLTWVNAEQTEVSSTSDAFGHVTFAQLDSTKQYLVLELSQCAGYEAEGGKTFPASYDAPIVAGMTAAQAVQTYTAQAFDLSKRSLNSVVDERQPLLNVKPYVRFQLTKRSSVTSALLDHAQYRLYSCTMAAFEAAGGDVSAIHASDIISKPTDVYETGSTLDENGERHTGVLVTGAQQDGLVYWFREISQPVGYKLNTGIVGPYAPEAVYGAMKYEQNSTVTAEQTDDPYEPGGGSRDLRCFFNVEIRKELYDKTDTTKIKNLPNATFELCLADRNFNKVEGAALCTFITGLDKAVANYAEVAGRGVSVTLEFSALYADSAYQPYIKRTVVNEGESGEYYDYTANFVLREIAYPSDTTPVQTSWPLTITTAGVSGGGSVRYVSDTTYVAQPIHNVQAKDVPVRFHKVGYSVADRGAVWNLAGVSIAVYSDRALKNLVDEQVTDKYGLCGMLLAPNTTYYYVETATAAGYEMEAATGSFTTTGYGVEMPAIELRNPQLRVLNVTKTDALGQAMPHVTLKVTCADGSDITDGNGKPVTNTFTTDENGQFSVNLPFGSYTLAELGVTGEDGVFHAATPEEANNFQLVNEVVLTDVTFGADDASTGITLVNPDKGKVVVTKTDDAGAPVNGIVFDVYYRAFADQAEYAAGATAPEADSITGALPGVSGGTAWTTAQVNGVDGRIEAEGLIPGWYKLVERTDVNYVDAGADLRTHVLQVTANGMGQTGDATTAIALSVVNQRRGYLRIEKSFVGTLLTQLPDSVTFKAYRSADLSDANPIEIVVPINPNTGAGTVDTLMDPVTWYVVEQEGAWYADYAVHAANIAVTEDDLTLMQGAVAADVQSAHTAASPLTLTVVNRPALATISGLKQDMSSAHAPIEGVQFAIYYMNGADKLYYHADTASWTAETEGRMLATTDAAGSFTFAKIRLPLAYLAAPQTTNTYYIEETYAPPEYEMAAPTPVVVTRMDNVVTLVDPIFDNSGLYIDLTKYGRKRVYAPTDEDVLGGAEITLYRVDEDGVGTLAAVGVTANDGTLRFPNLPRLTDGSYYAMAETATPVTHVADSLAVWAWDAALGQEMEVTPQTVTVDGTQRTVFRVADMDTVRGIKAYNTPKGSAAILKYNYLDHTTATAAPYRAQFALYNEAGELLRQDLYTGSYLNSTPDLPGYTKDSATKLFKGTADGVADTYFTVALAGYLEPGKYTLREIAAAEHGFLTMDEAKCETSDPWYPVAEFEIDDNGCVAVAVFANVPMPASTDLKIRKSVTAINGRDPGDMMVPDLQNGWQSITYTIEDFAASADKPFQLPLNYLTLEDPTMTFAAGEQAATAEHYVEWITLGRAGYGATLLHATPSTDPVYAAVYGLKDGAATWLETVDVTDESCKVTFQDMYDGFRVVYGVAAGTETLIGLKDGFYATAVEAVMVMRQDHGHDVSRVTSVKNEAAVELKYNIGQQEAAVARADAPSELLVEDAPSLPHMVVTKAAQRISERVEKPAEYAMPGDTFTYTLTMKNVSDGTAAMVDPVLMDSMPAQLSFDVAQVQVGTLPSGLTADMPVANGNNIIIAFHGKLPAGKSVTVTITATVKTSVTTQSGSFQNKAYLFSTYMLPKNSENPTGTSFVREDGRVPEDTVDGSLIGQSGVTYLAISDTTEHTIAKQSSLHVYKMVSADLSGAENFIGNEGNAFASAGGLITYKLVVSNSEQSETQHNVRIMDKLPRVGDRRVTLDAKRLSEWPVTLVSVSTPKGVPCTVYFTDAEEVATGDSSKSNYNKALSSGDFTGWSTTGSMESALAVAVDFGDYELAPGQSLTVLLTCRAPSASEAESIIGTDNQTAYLKLSNNDFTANATAVDGTQLSYNSVYAKVCLMPEKQRVGNRVWIDKNGNGIQDVAEGEDIDNPSGTFSLEPTYTGALTLTLRQYTNSDTSYATLPITLNNGFYTVDGVYPARLAGKVTTADAYDALGNILSGKLYGVNRMTYQVAASDIPAGWLVTGAYANTSDGKAPIDDARRTNDSNFNQIGDTFVSERFYLPIGRNDVTIDLGLVRVRDLALTKVGTDGRAVDGAIFDVYGPYTTSELTQGVNLDNAAPVAVLTTVNGKASFTSTRDNYLNHYSSYVVVERQQAGFAYAAEGLSATGAACVGRADQWPGIVGGGITDKRSNYFVLTAKAENDTTTTDSVTVTDRYEATGTLTVSGTKTFNGVAPTAGLFTFVMTSADDPDTARGNRTCQVLADGTFSFGELAYHIGEFGGVTYADAGKTYVYTIAEQNDGAQGITYDSHRYTLTVTVQDMGAGKLRVTKVLTCDGAAADDIAFVNTGVGQLTVTKTVAGNGGEENRDFDFTLTVKNPDGTPLTGVVPAEGRYTSVSFDNAGKASVKLHHGDTLTLSTLLSGSTYTVTEADVRGDGYVTTSSGAAGTVTDLDHPCVAAFTNSRNVGAVKVSKTLHGNLVSPTDVFTFTMTLTAPDGTGINVDRTYPCLGAMSALTFTAGQCTFTLKAGESVTVLDLPASIRYDVTEAEFPPYIASVVFSDSAKQVTAAMKDDPATVAFVNATHGGLTISKTVMGSGAELDRAFTFTLRFWREDGKSADGTYDALLIRTTGEETKATLTISKGVGTVLLAGERDSHSLALRGGESFNISGLVTGCTYSVTEEDATAAGYTTLPATRTVTDTIHTTDGAYEASFINTRELGALLLEKQTEGNAADRLTTFDMTVSLTHDTMPTAKTYPCVGTGSLAGMTTIAFAEDVQSGAAKATVSMQPGDTLTISGISAGTVYGVDEASYAAEGYTATGSGSSGVIEEKKTAACSYVNTRNAGTLTVTKALYGNDTEGERRFPVTVTLTAKEGSGVTVDRAYPLTGSATDAAGLAQTEAVFAGGQATLYLKGGASFTLSDIPTDTSYAVTETVSDGYSAAVAYPDDSHIVTLNDSAVTLTNTRNQYAPLSLTKTVSGNAPDFREDFHFTLTLSRTDGLPVDGVYDVRCTQGGRVTDDTLRVTGGKADISLKAGQTMEISRILTGTTYALAEEDYTAEGYLATVAGGALAGVVTVDGVFATVNNERFAGTLTLSKALHGNAAERDRAFTMTVTLTAPASNPALKLDRTYPCSGALDSLTFVPGGQGTAQATVALKGGQTVTVSDLPEGVRCTVTEQDYTAEEYHSAQVMSPEDGVVARNGADGVIPVTVTFTNTRNTYASIEVSKTVSGTAAERDRAFSFRVQLAARADGLPVDGTYAATRTLADGRSEDTTVRIADGQADLTLAHGEKMRIDGILTGTTATVTETVPAAEGYVSTPDGGVMQLVLAARDTVYPMAFTNARASGSVVVSKAVTGNAAETDKDFTFTVTMANSAGVNVNRDYPVVRTGSDNTQTDETLTIAQGTARITLKPGETLRIGQVYHDTTVTITEEDYTAEGYTIAQRTHTVTVTREGQSVQAAFTNDRASGTLAISKTVSGAAADMEKAFGFTVSMRSTAGVTVDRTYPMVRTLADGTTAAETLTVSAGTARVTLKAGETLRVDHVFHGTEWTVTEDDYTEDGYLTAQRTFTGSIRAEGQTGEAAFVNTRESGTVEISKTVAGNAADTTKAFDFTVSMRHETLDSVDWTYPCVRVSASGRETQEQLVVIGGEAHVTLLPGQALRVGAVIKGTRVTVTEADYTAEGYQADHSSTSGSITKEGDVIRAAFVNTRNEGALTLTKTLAGNGTEATRDFRFTLLLSREDTAPVAGDYTYTMDNGDVGTLAVGDDGTAEVTLRGGQSMTIAGILTGTAYTVAEDSYAAEGYATRATGNVGTITEDVSTAAFTNTRYVGTLTISKTLSGNATETDRAFTFTVAAQLPNGRALTGTFPVTGVEGVRSVTFRRGLATVSLRGGQSITIQSLLRGTTYTVTELEANADNYVTTSTDASGTITTAGMTCTFVNSRSVTQAYKSVTVVKRWSDAEDRDQLRPSTLTVYLYNERGVLATQVLSASNGWTATFDNLPVYQLSGEMYTYHVTEQAIEGYYGVMAADGDTFTITNTHELDPFVPVANPPRGPGYTTLLDNNVPLGGNTNMNEGDCFN